MKNGKAVGYAALGMFAWGLVKALTMVDAQHGCPLCRADDVADPVHLGRVAVLGPLLEEAQFRATLPKLIGNEASAMAFGAAHAAPHLGVLGNALRVLEAGLAGGVVYAGAYKNGGLLGATLAHGAHNLGVAVGLYGTLRGRAQAEGWALVPVEAEHVATSSGPMQVVRFAHRPARPLKFSR